MSNNNTLKTIQTITLILGIFFMLVGMFYQIPDREIPYNYEEYVGGDAYNMMIEASIRGGEIAGATIAKAIYITFGTTLLLITICIYIKRKEKEQKNIDPQSEMKDQE